MAIQVGSGIQLPQRTRRDSQRLTTIPSLGGGVLNDPLVTRDTNRLSASIALLQSLGEEPRKSAPGLLETLIAPLDYLGGAARGTLFALSNLNPSNEDIDINKDGDNSNDGNLFTNLRRAWIRNPLDANQRIAGFGDVPELQWQDDDSFIGKAIKGTTAFAGDVLFDPLTYVTFGTGALAKAAVSKAAGQAIGREVGERLAREGAEELTDRAARSVLRDSSVFRARAAREAGMEVADEAAVDRLLRTLPKSQLAKDSAEEIGFRAQAAFRRGGPGGLRTYLDDLAAELGDADIAKVLDNLPKELRMDLEGGIRLTTATGRNVKTLRKGGGRVGTAISEGSSAIGRTRPGQALTLGRDRALKQQAKMATARKSAGDLVDAAMVERALSVAQQTRMAQRVAKSGLRQKAGSMYAIVEERLAKEDGQQFAEAMARRESMRDEVFSGRLADPLDGDALTPLEREAFEAADALHAHNVDAYTLGIEKYGADFSEAGVYEGSRRVLSDDGEKFFRRTARAGGKARGSGKFRSRSNFEIVDEEFNVVGYQSLREANEAARTYYGIDYDLFETDPMKIFVKSMSQVEAREQKAIKVKLLRESGLAVDADFGNVADPKVAQEVGQQEVARLDRAAQRNRAQRQRINTDDVTVEPTKREVELEERTSPEYRQAQLDRLAELRARQGEFEMGVDYTGEARKEFEKQRRSLRGTIRSLVAREQIDVEYVADVVELEVRERRLLEELEVLGFGPDDLRRERELLPGELRAETYGHLTEVRVLRPPMTGLDGGDVRQLFDEGGFAVLSKSEKARLRNGWLAEDGISIEEAAADWVEANGLDQLDIEEFFDSWLEATRRLDAADQLEKYGKVRNPQALGGFNPQPEDALEDIKRQLLDEGVDIDAMVDEVAQVRKQKRELAEGRAQRVAEGPEKRVVDGETVTAAPAKSTDPRKINPKAAERNADRIEQLLSENPDLDVRDLFPQARSMEGRPVPGAPDLQYFDRPILDFLGSVADAYDEIGATQAQEGLLGELSGMLDATGSVLSRERADIGREIGKISRDLAYEDQRAFRLEELRALRAKRQEAVDAKVGARRDAADALDQEFARIVTDRSGLEAVLRSVAGTTGDEQVRAYGAVLDAVENLRRVDYERLVNQFGEENTRAQRARAAYERVKGLDRTRGTTVADQLLGEGFVRMRAGVGKRGQQLAIDADVENLFVSEVLVDAMARHHEVSKLPSRFEQDVFGPLLSAWKQGATFGRGPGFVYRNIVGGAYNAWLVGANARDFRKAAEYTLKLERAYKAFRRTVASGEVSLADAPTLFDDVLRKELGDELFAAHQQMRNRGVFGGVTEAALGDGGGQSINYGARGVIGRGRESLFERTEKGAPVRLRELNKRDGGLVQAAKDKELRVGARVVDATVNNPWMSFMSTASEISETYLRSAVYFTGLRRYGSDDLGHEMADILVKTSQFDYQDQAAGIETRVLRTLAPFFVWTKNNVPLQLRSVFMQPGRANTALKALDNAQKYLGSEDQDELDGYLPQFVRETLGFTSKFEVGGNPVAIGLNLPVTDINRMIAVPTSIDQAKNYLGTLAGGSRDDALGALNPAAKTLIESITGVNTFTGAKFSDTQAGPVYRVASLLPFLPNAYNDADTDTVVASGFAQNQFRNLLPQLGQLDRLLPFAQQGNNQQRLPVNWFLNAGGSVLPITATATLTPSQIRGEVRTRTMDVEKQLDRAANAQGTSASILREQRAQSERNRKRALAAALAVG